VRDRGYGEFGAEPATEEEPFRPDVIVPYKQRDAAPGAPPPAFTGDKELYPAGAWSRQAQLHIQQLEPLPLNVQLMISHVYAPWVQP
jgi:hypothetical protein